MEKAINFKVDEELYKLVKIKAIQEGKSMKEYIISLLLQDLKQK